MKICVAAGFKTLVSVITLKKSEIELWKWKYRNDADNVLQKTTRASRVTCFKGITSSSSPEKNRISANFDKQKKAVTRTAKRNTGFMS